MKKYFIAAMIFGAVACGVFMPANHVAAQAVNVCSGSGSGSVYCQNKGSSVESVIKNVVNVLLMAVGIISVIMIIIGGILFTLSNGDASRIARARSTVIYAAVGLAVALLAGAIVNFVIYRV